MAQEKTKTKPYKEVVEKTLHNEDYGTESNGKFYPANRVKVELISYSWEIEKNDGTLQPYEWLKVAITNSKLILQDGQNVVKPKIVKTAKWETIVNDETKVKLSVDEFFEILEKFKGVDKSEFEKKS